MSPAKFQPALFGGIVMGVLSALPLINFANCCCAWVLFGGALAAYLMQQNHPAPITAGDGALVGMLAGVIGAVLWAAISIAITVVAGPFQEALFERVLENARDLPPEVREVLDFLRGSAGLGLGIVAQLVGMVFAVFVGGFFGAIGGILGALIFRTEVPPPPPPPLPPDFSPATFTPPTFTPPPPPEPPPGGPPTGA